MSSTGTIKLLKMAIKSGFEIDPADIQLLCHEQDNSNEALKNEIRQLAEKAREDAQMFDRE